MTVMLQGLLSCMVHLVVMLSLRYLPLYYLSCPLTVICVTDRTGQYVRRLLEPAFTAVPLAAEVPNLFQTALHCSGTLPFPVPDTFCESQKRQDDDMKYYLAPEMVQAGLPLPCMYAMLAYAFHGLCSMQICCTDCGQ